MMFRFYKTFWVASSLCASLWAAAQPVSKINILDAATREPVAGATVSCEKAGCSCGCPSNAAGEISLNCSGCGNHTVSATGYQPQRFGSLPGLVELQGLVASLQAVVLTANRGEATRRIDAPVAIATISNKLIQDTKPTSLDQLLNKISGVNMVNLGNEQHQMSIRQPITTKSLFLYLEDGVPIRTSGLFNHNALLEINMAAVRSVEVIKGPSSSLYGSEAIGGVVNFITTAPAAVPVARVSVQANNRGYKRTDLLSSVTSGRWGVVLSGYYAAKANGFLEYTDFHKATATARVDYRFSPNTSLSNSATILRYYSDMSGTIDSTMFASRSFKNPQTFTYRNVAALRYRSTLVHNWSTNSRTTLTALYRTNTIAQNPAYRIKDDYHKVNGSFTGSKALAHGEINDNSFHSYAFVAQHRQSLGWNKAVLVGGLNVDISPSAYRADYIRIRKDTISKKYVGYQTTDSVLTHYATDLNNYAGFLSFEYNPLARVRMVASIRYDYFHYQFNNALPASAFSGAPDSRNNFSRVSPKLGLTYNCSKHTGLYASYSEGFVPPQVTELYTGVQVPQLSPAVFYNYEAGGWAQLVADKLNIELSVYRLRGTNEIVSVKQDDGAFVNQNTGCTLHQGVELGLYAALFSDLTIRVSGAYSNHRFVQFVEKGIAYTGKEMNGAPHVLGNAELWYKPRFAKHLRLGAEWQCVGAYFTDPLNTNRYKGYNLLHLRAGYHFKALEWWINVLNASGTYYATIASKSSFGYSYQLGDPRTLTMGLAFDFGTLLGHKHLKP